MKQEKLGGEVEGVNNIVNNNLKLELAKYYNDSKMTAFNSKRSRNTK